MHSLFIAPLKFQVVCEMEASERLETMHDKLSSVRKTARKLKQLCEM